jgi:hypothetical protein
MSTAVHPNPNPSSGNEPSEAPPTHRSVAAEDAFARAAATPRGDDVRASTAAIAGADGRDDAGARAVPPSRFPGFAARPLRTRAFVGSKRRDVGRDARARTTRFDARRRRARAFASASLAFALAFALARAPRLDSPDARQDVFAREPNP